MTNEQERVIEDASGRVDDAVMPAPGVEAIIDSIPAMVAFMTPSGELEQVNRQIMDYIGAPLHELKKWQASETVHPDDLPSVIAAWMHSVDTGAPYEIEHRIRRADGVYRWFHVRGLPIRDSEGAITRWCVLQVDIDERRRDKVLIANALAEVSASEERLRGIIDAVPGFVWSASPEGSVGFVNQRWCDYTGMSLEQACGHGWTASIHPDDAPGLAVYWQGILQSGNAGEYEARLKRFDGVYRWFLIRAVPQRDDTGKLVRWYGENTDIEDRKRAEVLLSKARSELTHLARVASLGAVTASIAHEVNQPLAGIITNASTCLRMLGADPPNVDGARETARRTIRDGNRAADVINRLRALFSKKSITIEDVNLNDAAREVIAMLLGELQRNGVVLHPQFAEALPLVRGDRVQLQQVILNLIMNAAEAMSAIHGRPRQLIVSTGLAPDESVYLAVKDSGNGVDPQDIERIFNAFYTTKSSGMGVGLSISRSIIERHDGKLWASANDGPGATFTFAIPNSTDLPQTANRDLTDRTVEND
ncbi:PAS domain-containing sensor histidine kinase [Pseudomonas fluorescens]|uniref:PAS domain-containing sensor histidine kinase n=1 Tax=Pseudomonas fluorescens TaxID=294 RepID=UPI00259B014E|nr:PAS domain-containing protein [Pseudomonas fluorescens]WJK12204.1 PAS domain-containing protein [Pseudomonas fluorescens]